MSKRIGITIQQYLNKNIKDSTKATLNFLISKGYSLDYKPSYGVVTFGHLFLDYDLDVNDFIFICNRFSKVMSKGRNIYECMDNFRFSINQLSQDYIDSQNEGCCGFFDEIFLNPLTKNKLFLGFNFGH